MNSKNIIDSRTTSSFGISIGTSLALETIFGVDKDTYDNERVFNRITINDYKFYYINVLTLIRNIYTSIASIDLTKLLDSSHKEIIENTLYGEIEMIDSLFRSVKCEVVFFLPNYGKVSNKVFLRSNKSMTKKDTIHVNSISMLSSISKELTKLNLNILEGTHKLDSSQDKILITTHIAVDLLNYKNVRQLFLLESHTGIVKRYSEFNSKYLKSKVLDTNRLPFTEILLRLLGDNLILETPLVKFNSNISTISELHKWNPLTSRTKVITNLKGDKDVRDSMNALMYRGMAYG